MGRYLLTKLQGLEAYIPGEHTQGDEWIRLNTNESPFAPAKGVREAVDRAINGLGYYNDPDVFQLRTALAELYGVQREQVIVGNGSDELLYMAFMAFADAEHPIVMPDITYSYYDLFMQALGIVPVRIPLKADFTVDPQDYIHAPGMIVLANPNAPTGRALTVEQIEEIVKGNPDQVVLIDEAYVDFGAQSCLPLIDRYDNLLVVRTFSKSRQLAGARLGYAFAGRTLMDDMNRVRNAVNVYSVNAMTQAAGIAVVQADAEVRKNCEAICRARTMTTEGLRRLGFTLQDSMGNFVFARPPKGITGRQMQQRLRERGILVRRWDAPRIEDYLRITIGTDKQMQALLEAAQAILEEAKA